MPVPNGESPTSPKRLAIFDKHKQALERRKDGLSYDAIAQELGYSTAQGAYAAVKAMLLKSIREPADEVRQVENERLDVLFHKVYTRAKESGDEKDITQCLAIMNRKARLLGLDAPTKVAPTTPSGNDSYQSTADYSKLTVAELETLKALLVKAGDDDRPKD